MAENYKSENSNDESVNSDEKIVELARKRYKLSVDAWSDIRKAALADLRFCAGDHWPEEMKRDRERDNRPMLVINRMPQLIRQVTNDQRQNRPAIKVSPVDRGADIETAKILQGIIRHIEYNSNAEDALDTAFEGAVRKGFGFFRVTTDYADPLSFNQEIFIKKIRNHFSVLIDPHSKESDGSDMKWAIIEENIPKEDFPTMFPEHELSKCNDWTSYVSTSEGWVEDDSVKIAEYFEKVFEKRMIYLLANGQVIDQTKFIEGMDAVKSRESEVPVIKWYKIAGTEIVDRTDWAGKWIPLIPVYGDENDIEGKLTLESLIRHSKDSNLMYDVFASAEAEAISLAPKAPWVATPEQIKGFEQLYKDANKKNIAVLPYNPVGANGVNLPPPQRNSIEPAVAAISQARMLSADDIKNTSGIFDAGMGAQSNEVSGVAIAGRQRQIQTSNFHFVDNLNRSIRHLGRILIDLIPKIYDQQQMIRIIGEDGVHKTVTINGPQEEGSEYDRVFDLSIGRYDVIVGSGPSYATKRQEALQTMMSLAQSYPQIMEIAGDLLVTNMDWDQAQEISSRIKKTIDPNILGDEKQEQLPPQVVAQMQQLQMQVQAMAQELQFANQKLNNKALELESKERIEAAKIDADLVKKAADIDSKHALALLTHQMQETQQWQNQVTDAINFLVQQNQNLNGPQMQQSFAPDENQNPTGGQSPGIIME